MQKSEKPSFIGTIFKPLKKAVLPVLSILGIAVGQDNISNTLPDSSMLSGDRFVMSDTAAAKDTSWLFDISDTTKPAITNPELIEELDAYDSLRAHGFNLIKIGDTAKSLPDSSKSISGVWRYVQHTLPKP